MRNKLILILLATMAIACTKSSSGSGTGITPVPPITDTGQISWWLTKNDRSVLLQKQNPRLSFGSNANGYVNIVVDTTQTYQTVDGFGYALTGGSAQVINGLPAAQKAALLQELFGSDSSSIGISYLRVSIGASDLNDSVFSYDDMPLGQTDTGLAHFSLGPDQAGLVPLLQEILQINPSLKIIATPWSAPVWMKDNNSSVGGSLLTQYYGVYARYFVKYIEQMQSSGIHIDAITPQNEPLNPGNNPSMVMTAAEETDFIKGSLGPAFQAAGLTTKIVAYDHNCDQPGYALTVLGDPQAGPYVYGSAFHLYAGDISALSQVHQAFPDKALYFTEQWTSSAGNFGGDLDWHLKNVVIGSMRNWSRTALEWNLANDPYFQPHTPGGCTQCQGALTIGSSITRNVGYYIIAHASKFVPSGSVRIASNVPANLQNVAFKTPEGQKVLIVENDGSTDAGFNIYFKNKWATAILPAGAVATYVWN